MNLSKLFEIQKGLDHHIIKEKGLEGQDLLDMKILALQVELGECANEWRGFKFWKVNPEPRTEILIECEKCGGSGRDYYDYCGSCHGGYVGKRNPLLEEYVDCLHFILSIGLELNISNVEGLEPFKVRSGITQRFNALFNHIGGLKMQLEASLDLDVGYKKYYRILNMFLGLGEMLGFEWEQIEQAYLQKNKINYERQNTGY